MRVWKTSIQLGQQKLLKMYKYVYQQLYIKAFLFSQLNLNHDKTPLLMDKE